MIYYKFKSAKDFHSLSIEEDSCILASRLRAKVLEANKLRDDLELRNYQTDEIYNNNDLIPIFTRVTVTRKPRYKITPQPHSVANSVPNTPPKEKGMMAEVVDDDEFGESVSFAQTTTTNKRKIENIQFSKQHLSQPPTKSEQRNTLQPNFPRSRDGCFRCGQHGHFAANCPTNGHTLGTKGVPAAFVRTETDGAGNSFVKLLPFE
eukprot:c9373_g1_i1.p1 GENE.c9373_g1_i1~~c9373_g1_i1.p1  ORF type:complete len:236 (+),score=29.71 c9373_g1_i1:93-710(+)